jgi:hypothetical protein
MLPRSPAADVTPRKLRTAPKKGRDNETRLVRNPLLRLYTQLRSREKERKSKGGEGRTVILQGDIGAVFGLEHLGLVQLGQPEVYKQELVALNRVQKIAGL